MEELEAFEEGLMDTVEHQASIISALREDLYRVLIDLQLLTARVEDILETLQGGQYKWKL